MSEIVPTVDFDADGKQIGWLRLPHSVTRSAYGVIQILIKGDLQVSLDALCDICDAGENRQALRDFLAERPGRGLPTEAPIFIVGLPRSGTTLVEMIVTTTGKVAPLGEPALQLGLGERPLGMRNEHGPRLGIHLETGIV